MNLINKMQKENKTICEFCGKERKLAYRHFQTTSGFYCRECIKVELELEKQGGEKS